MQLTTRLLAISFAVGALVLPQQAQAGNNNNNAMQQMMMLNSVNAQEQKISSQINAYAGSGQLSPQQAAAFNSELSQISSQAMMGGGNPVAAVAQLNNLSAQINSSLIVPSNPYVYGAATRATTNPYVYGAATNPYVYGAATNPGFYSNWRSRLAHDEHYLHNKEWQAEHNSIVDQNRANQEANELRNRELQIQRQESSEHNLIGKERHNAEKQFRAEEHSDAIRRYNAELNARHSAAEKDAYRRTHPYP